VGIVLTWFFANLFIIVAFNNGYKIKESQVIGSTILFFIKILIHNTTFNSALFLNII